MQTKIEIPAGQMIDSVNHETGAVTFKPIPKDVFNTIKSVDDAIELLGASDVEVIIYKQLLSALDANSHAVKQQEAIILVKAFNEGWVPDWNDDDQYKYFPWFYMGGSSGFRYDGYDGWYAYSNVGSRLALKSAELAKHVGTRFIDVYKGFMVL